MVEAINGANRNTVIYTAAGAVAGGGAAATFGYLSKPYIKNGIPTDGFCDSFISVVKKDNPDITKTVENIYSALKSINSKEDLKAMAKVGEAALMQNLDEDMFAQIKAAVSQGQEAISKVGVDNKDIAKIFSGITEAESPEQLKGTVSEIINKGIDLIDIEAFKKAISDIEANSKLIKKAIGAGAWYTSIDNEGKLMSEEINPVVKYIKAAAKKVKLKTAGIYGAIGAAVVGTAGYIASKTDNKV